MEGPSRVQPGARLGSSREGERSLCGSRGGWPGGEPVWGPGRKGAGSPCRLRSGGSGEPSWVPVGSGWGARARSGGEGVGSPLVSRGEQRGSCPQSGGEVAGSGGEPSTALPNSSFKKKKRKENWPSQNFEPLPRSFCL